MVIGNGFFSDSREAALREMAERSQCEVRPLPYPTIGNISYFVGYTGDLYGQQLIAGRPLTRQSKHLRWASGWTARFSDRPHHQVQHKLQVLTWSTFVALRWTPDIRLEFINGNPYDVRPSNLREQQTVIPPEWAETMERRKDLYRSRFLDVAWSVNYVTGQSLDDCKDAAQDAFIYLCCEGYMGHQRETDEFIGLWKRVARYRAEVEQGIKTEEEQIIALQKQQLAGKDQLLADAQMKLDRLMKRGWWDRLWNNINL